MKLFKKFLLAAATVGLVGSFGFASQVKAAEDTITSLSFSSNAATANVSVVSSNKVNFYLENNKIGEAAINDGVATLTGIKSLVNGGSFSGLSLSNLEARAVSSNGVEFNTPASKKNKTIGPLYKVSVSPTNGTVSPASQYGYYDDMLTFTASPNPSSYVIDKWDGEESTSLTKEIRVTDNTTTNTSHTVVFKSNTVTTQATLTYRVKLADGTYTPEKTVSTMPDTVSMKKGEIITITTNSGARNWTKTMDNYFDNTGNDFAAKAAGSIQVRAGAGNGYTDSEYLTINISDDFKVSNFKIKGDDYVTGDKDKDYYVELTPTDIKEGTGYQAYGITWEVTSDSKATLTGLSTNSKTGTSVSDIKGVRVKYTGDSIDAGKTATIEVKATIKNGKAASGTDSDLVLTHKITVYPKFSLTYSSDKRTLAYKAPAKINTGTTSGQDSDNKDATKTAFEVKGIKLDPVVGGSVVNDIISLSKTKSLGTDKTIDASTIESIVIELNKKNKFSGDSCDLVFRAYPCDTDGKYNKEIKAEQTATVYKVVLHVTTGASSGTDKTTNTNNAGGGVASLSPLPVALISPVGTTVATAGGTATDYVFYLLPGQEISEDVIASIYPALKGVKLTDAAGNSITKITGSSSVTSNNYKGVLGVKTTAADSAPDGQQKWGQGNTFAYIMMILVICGVCAGLYALNRKKSNI